MLGGDPGPEDLGYLRRQAERCARLAAALNDRRAREELERMAGEFESLVQRALPGREDRPPETVTVATVDDTGRGRMLDFP